MAALHWTGQLSVEVDTQVPNNLLLLTLDKRHVIKMR